MINFAKIFADNRAKVLSGKTDSMAIVKLSTRIRNIEESDLGTIKGVGDTTVEKLIENGIGTIKELKEAGIEEVEKMRLNPISMRGIKEQIKN